SPAQTKNYFDSLLPEGYTRRTVAQWIHADEDDYLTILHALGCECLGAMQITAEDETHGASYEPLALDQVKALAAEGASKSAELVISSHLSLAGATGKVGLYFDGKNWYLPRGTAPSTHIVKQSHVRLKHIVQNEQLALTTARNCGLQVADSFIINTGSGADEEILLAAGRYDRSFSNAGRVIDGLTAPLRLHQEDFAQALGIPASRKYERAGEDHMARMFDLLRRHSADPIRDMTRLWDQIVFNWLIGNTDAHVKNFSLLYSPDLRTLRLAPAYDLLGAAIYPTTREISFRIGGAATLDAVTEASFEAAAREAGLGVRMAMQRYHRMVETFVPAIRAASEALQAEGFPEAAELAEQILRTGGIALTK
ncbi:MAG: HipA domain-containing protein, partial [Oscillospiraceae bacterium]|nr:HipA domain-containing protein [Oscillospiraceae bacterium]